jgi:hypothetical protein
MTGLVLFMLVILPLAVAILFGLDRMRHRHDWEYDSDWRKCGTVRRECKLCGLKQALVGADHTGPTWADDSTPGPLDHEW